jgi:hypothetical protein
MFSPAVKLTLPFLTFPSNLSAFSIAMLASRSETSIHLATRKSYGAVGYFILFQFLFRAPQCNNYGFMLICAYFLKCSAQRPGPTKFISSFDLTPKTYYLSHHPKSLRLGFGGGTSSLDPSPCTRELHVVQWSSTSIMFFFVKPRCQNLLWEQ